MTDIVYRNSLSEGGGWFQFSGVPRGHSLSSGAEPAVQYLLCHRNAAMADSAGMARMRWHMARDNKGRLTVALVVLVRAEACTATAADTRMAVLLKEIEQFAGHLRRWKLLQVHGVEGTDRAYVAAAGGRSCA